MVTRCDVIGDGAPSRAPSAVSDTAHPAPAHPGTALRMAKRLLREGQRTGLETLLEMTAAYQAIAHHTPEHDAAMQRLFERKP